MFGRILFPKKNQNGETKSQGLGHAFVWVFRDEDQDGEPDWEDSSDLIEEFGETDENGYFSFYLEEAGEYSFIIDLPGQLSALSPEPIDYSQTQAKPRSWVMLSALIGNQMFEQILSISKESFHLSLLM